jgi:hypothetical protein
VIKRDADFAAAYARQIRDNTLRPARRCATPCLIAILRRAQRLKR